MKSSLLLLSLLPLSLLSFDADLKSDGERLYIRHGCYGCHGASGEGVNGFPRLAGKPRSYLVGRLQALKSGRGGGKRKEMMIPYAKALDEKEIEAVAAYLASPAKESEESLEVPEDILGGSNM